MINELERLLETRVRPFLREHGGDAEILGYADGILKLRMLGQCAGCPAAMLTNETLIEAELKQACSELRQVVLVQETSDFLLSEAKRLMTRGSFPSSTETKL
jgi:Fe/S biogenesis protein NfuA